MPDRPLLILFGSQTGTAEEVADRLAAESLRWHFAPRVVPMEEYDVARLPGEPFVVCVASTTGEGEVPDGMRPLWSFLLRRDLPPGSLRGVRHAVFGLGDSSYAKFNFAAKRLARRLAQLGSPALVPLGLGDDQEALGLDQALEPWAQSLWEALAAALPLPAGRPPLPEGLPPPPRYSVEVLPASSAPTPATPAAAATGPPGPRAPHMARVLANEALTAGSGGGREVRHIEFDIGGSGMEYAAGDALAVQPRNDRGATLQLLADLGFDPAQRVRITRAQPHAPPLPRDEWSVLELFEERLDAFGVPRARFCALLAPHATDPAQRERLAEFGTAEGAGQLRLYVGQPRRTAAEVLADFRSARPPLAAYLDLLPPLRHRYFSIASSPLAHPTAVHLCVAVVRYRSMLAAPRRGVCSNFLAALQPNGDARVGVWLRKGCLRLPAAADAPLLMIGPGTGVAPFRAFVQERAARRARGEALGPADLYFGCRSEQSDFLYAEEWKAHAAAGALTEFVTAFSRDTPQKVYVQHRMAEEAHARRIAATLAAPNAHVFIAGASNQMPKAVRAALRAAAVAHGGVDEAAADEMLRRLEADGRFQQETW